jgi:hypothetical protein
MIPFWFVDPRPGLGKSAGQRGIGYFWNLNMVKSGKTPMGFQEFPPPDSAAIPG